MIYAGIFGYIFCEHIDTAISRLLRSNLTSIVGTSSIPKSFAAFILWCPEITMFSLPGKVLITIGLKKTVF